MSISFGGIGEYAATFHNSSSAPAVAGKAVKISGNGEVSACSAGDNIAGVCISAGAQFAAVQLRGFVKLPYSGAAPNLGYCRLSADSGGGVKTDSSGREYLVVEVDTSAKTAGLFL
mgnify:FL=1